ncbi:MAG: peptidase S10 [Maricaulis sp.]|nr:peptidase S10 [Maricaulis sp.]
MIQFPSRLFAATAFLALAACAQPEAPRETGLPTGASASSAHEGVFNGVPVSYTALVETTLLPGADGETAGRMVTTTYLADSDDPDTRPVLFLFNGGPGASTTPLHFGAFGPQRRFGEEEAQVLAPNPDSLLDVADLVFIDPIGTGYSTPETEEDGAQFWSPQGDAESVAAVIQSWLLRHDREASPRYVLGQSYGTVRAGAITRAAPDLDLDGILLFALVSDMREGDVSYAVRFPTMAATAWYHGRIPQDGRTAEQVFEQAVAFVETRYWPALNEGENLSEADRLAIADEMSAWIGLPADYIAGLDLRLSNRDFMLHLLEDEGVRTGQLDTRATRSLDAPAQRPPYDDPGLSYHPDSVDTSGLQNARGFDPAEHASIVEAYFQDWLGFEPATPYRALNLDVNRAWDWGPDGFTGFGGTNAYYAEAMAADPGLRLFWAAGYYDLSTPAYAGRHGLAEAGVPADRLTAAYFPAGHSVFVGEANRALLGDAVRDFLVPHAD